MNIATRRLLAGDDLCTATQLLIRFFREEGFETPDDVITRNVQRMAELEVCAVIIAEDGDTVIGVATVSMEFGIEYGWSAEMGDLYVLPDWRGRGVSRALVETVEVFLRTRGAAGYQVTVTPYAEDAHDLKSFYVKLGFANEGRNVLYRWLTPQ